jgi:hypothetical protein
MAMKSKGWVRLFVAAAFMGGLGAVGNAMADAPDVSSRHFSKAQLEIDVSQAAETTWTRIGKFCDIRTWLEIPCAIIEGKEEDVGAIRLLMGSIVEVMTSKTASSYAYAAVDTPSSQQRFIHGSLEARPVGRKHCKLLYTLIYDDTQVASEVDRNHDLATRIGFLQKGLAKMKDIAEHP